MTTEPVKITTNTYYSPQDPSYILFVDNEPLYHSFDEEQSKEYLEDIIKDLERRFKKEHDNYRTFIERPNAWTAILQKARDGILLQGKPRQVHIIQIKQTHKLLKCIDP